MVTINRLIVPFLVVVIAVQFWAALSPSHYNWGLHDFAFYDPVWGGTALLVCLVALIPSVRSAVLARISGLVRLAGRTPPAMVFALLLVVWVSLMLLFPAKLHLLGDSEFILQLTPKLPSIEDVSANFRNQPLTYETLRLVQWISGGGGAVEPMTLYRIADGVAGIIYLGTIFLFLRTLALEPVVTFLLGIILLVRPGTQMFLGYVENYMFYYVSLSAYVITGWLALEEKTPLWLPLILLAIIPGFHIAGIIYFPTAILLFLPWWNSRRKYFFSAAGSLVVIALVGVLALGPSWVATRISDALRNDFLPLTTPPGGIPYGMFSAVHIVDWLNANGHILPFGLPLVAIGMIVIPWREYKGSAVFRFLTGSSVVGLVASFVILPALGMARDWDMLSNFFIPLRFLSVYFLILLLRAREFRHVLLMLAVFGMVRWIGWIGINADEGRHLARAEMLTVPELSGTFPKIYYENLAKVFVERQNYERAAFWYERYMSVDSANPRILANLSDCYRAIGDHEKLFLTLQRSAAAKSTNAGVYSNLAIEYIKRGDTARAVSLLNRGLQFDPTHLESHANLSILNMALRNFPESRRHAVEAIRLGLNDPILYKNAAYSSYFMSDYPNAVLFLNEYLKSAPADLKSQELFTILQRRLGPKSPVPR